MAFNDAPPVTRAPAGGKGLALDQRGNIPLAVRKRITGYEFDYEPFTAPVTVTSAVRGTPTTVVVGNSVNYDGATTVWIEFFAPTIFTAAVTNATVSCVVLDGATDIGRIAILENADADSGGQSALPTVGRLRVTPAAGPHVFTIAAFQAGGNAGVQAGPGGSGTHDAPGYIQVTRA